MGDEAILKPDRLLFQRFEVDNTISSLCQNFSTQIVVHLLESGMPPAIVENLVNLTLREILGPTAPQVRLKMDLPKKEEKLIVIPTEEPAEPPIPETPPAADGPSTLPAG